MPFSLSTSTVAGQVYTLVVNVSSFLFRADYINFMYAWMPVTQCGTTCQLDGPEYDRDDVCAYQGHKLRASDTPKMGTIPIATSSSHILIALLCHPMYERCSLQLWPCQQGPSHWPGYLRTRLRLKCIYLAFNNIILTLAHSSVFACLECFWIYQLRVMLPCVPWGKKYQLRGRSLPFFKYRSDLATRLGRSTGKAELTKK